MLARAALLALALLAVSAALAADEKPRDKAKDKKKEEPPKAGPFEFPLKVGTEWTYRVGDNRYLLKAAKLEKVGGQECVRLEMIVNGSVVSHEHMAVARIPKGSDKEGVLAVMRYSFEGKVATPPIPVLLLPENEKAWRVDSKIAGQPLKGLFRK